MIFAVFAQAVQPPCQSAGGQSRRRWRIALPLLFCRASRSFYRDSALVLLWCVGGVCAAPVARAGCDDLRSLVGERSFPPRRIDVGGSGGVHCDSRRSYRAAVSKTANRNGAPVAAGTTAWRSGWNNPVAGRRILVCGCFVDAGRSREH